MNDLRYPSQLDLIELKKKAKKIVVASAGDPPTYEEFEQDIIPDYPRWITRSVAFLLLITFLAAANISLFRLFNIARDHFLEDINIRWQSAIVGISVFLLAECAVIVSFIVMEVYHITGWKKNMLWFVIAGGLLTAYIGNYSFVRPDTLFGIIETLYPPTAVLGVALVAETLITEGAKERQVTKKLFEQATLTYKTATANPEKHPDFFRYFYYEVKDFIYKQNKRHEERKDYLDQLTDQEWVQIIKKALETDNLYLEAMSSFSNSRLPIGNGNGNVLKTDSGMVSENGHSGAGYIRKSKASEMVYAHLGQYPEDISLTLVQLAEKIGVSKSTVGNVIQEIKSNV